jgi:simple sugar transport system permease protein
MRLVPRIDTLEPVAIPFLSELPIVGPLLFNQNTFVYFSIVLAVVLGIVLFRTPVGLRLRAVGEHPRAADSAGISVALIRYAAVIIGGMLAGLAGAYITLVELGLFVTNVTGGRGFIAVALVVFGRWDPYRVLAGGLLFGFIDALQIRLQSAGAGVPEQFMVMMPYLLTILVLLVVGRRAVGPASLAVPFHRGER